MADFPLHNAQVISIVQRFTTFQEYDDTRITDILEGKLIEVTPKLARRKISESNKAFAKILDDLYFLAKRIVVLFVESEIFQSQVMYKKFRKSYQSNLFETYQSNTNKRERSNSISTI